MSRGRFEPDTGNPPGQTRRWSAFAKTGALAAAGALAISAIGTGGILAAPAAQAATDLPGMHQSGITVQAPPPRAFGDWSMWLGSLNLNGATGGPTAFCFDVGIPAGPAGSGAVGSLGNPQLNYAIQKYQSDPANHAALAYLTHELADPRFNVPWNGIGAPYPNLRDSSDPQMPGVRARAAAMLADAQANSGPYSTQPKLAMDANGRGGTITSTELVSAAGNKLSGFSARAILNGPAVWAGTNSQAVNLRTGDQLGFAATGNGTVSVTLTIDAPGSSATTYSVPGFQNLLVAGGAQPVAGTSADANVIFDFQPEATSTAGRFVEGGQPLMDVLHANTSTGNTNDWAFVNGGNVPARFDVDWYYSPVRLAPNAQIPAAVVKVASGTGTATGPGDVKVTGDKNADMAGYYYPVARFSKGAQPAELQQYFRADWTAGFNDPHEETIQKYQPAVVTKASAVEDGKIYDIITVTGNEPGKELSVTTDLVLTSAAPIAGGTDTVPADADVIGTVTTKVTGNGEFKTAAVEVPWEKIVAEKWSKGLNANLYFSEKIDGTESTKAWDGKELLPNETVPIKKPSIITKASGNGTVPLLAHDIGIVSGTIPSGTGIKVTTKVNQYKFDDSTDGSAQAVCANPSWSSPDQDVTGAGAITYPSHTIVHKGTYGYVEELKLTIDKGEGKEPFTAQLHKGNCGEKNETVIAFPEAVTVTPDKPALMVNTGFAPTTGSAQEAGPNMPLLMTGGTAFALALLGGAGLLYRKRFDNLRVETDNVQADEHAD
ncbi:hypothetical protein [Arthrobacter sp. FW306-2-2C-D06B]|uniref:hypothetical protein n=1 Tax=Arthrobacter sp. FW306-2-2C-D06B TaxID=2879618 RepID=UPI001F33156F|nr:hypothetical protein [Arthrobacter sp. FW306-2-2C-D06B]UKA57013.1 hypothetical protein LFT47_11835 [Arthrobacter sp. FW306-2-2C-D06B]